MSITSKIIQALSMQALLSHSRVSRAVNTLRRTAAAAYIIHLELSVGGLNRGLGDASPHTLSPHTNAV